MVLSANCVALERRATDRFTQLADRHDGKMPGECWVTPIGKPSPKTVYVRVVETFPVASFEAAGVLSKSRHQRSCG